MTRRAELPARTTDGGVQRAAQLRGIAHALAAALDAGDAVQIALAAWTAPGAVARAIGVRADDVSTLGRVTPAAARKAAASWPGRLLAAADLLAPAAAPSTVDPAAAGDSIALAMPDDEPPPPPPATPPPGRRPPRSTRAAAPVATDAAPPPVDAPAGRPRGALVLYGSSAIGLALDAAALATLANARPAPLAISLAISPDAAIYLHGTQVRRALAAASKRARSTGRPLRVTVERVARGASAWMLVLAWSTGSIRLLSRRVAPARKPTRRRDGTIEAPAGLGANCTAAHGAIPADALGPIVPLYDAPAAPPAAEVAA